MAPSLLESRQLTMPNFLVIGAARSGTTALYEFLNQHPQVFVSTPKEPHYFSFMGQELGFSGPGDEQLINSVAITDHGQYEALFDDAGDRLAIGECSVSYLYYPDTAGRIRQALPDVKIIAILRNPVERAYSAHLYLRKLGLEEEPDFVRALALEESRIHAGWHHLWHYKAMGYYGLQLERYFRLFDRDKILVVFQQDLRRYPQSSLKKVFGFLNVDTEFRPTVSTFINQGGIARSQLLQRVFNRSSVIKDIAKYFIPRTVRRRLRNMNLNRPTLPQEASRGLSSAYREDNNILQDLLGMDLLWWRQ